MATTSHVQITLVEQAQAQKEVTVNQALLRIDALLNTGAIDKDLATPPASPAEGDVYIVAAAPTDAWDAHEDDIAYFANGGWQFITPNEGMILWVNDEDESYVWDGTAWVRQGAILEYLDGVGINATPDATNKLSVSSDAVLFNHDGAGSQIKVNKNATADTASFVFQQGFTGKAEFGMTGNDNFTFKAGPGFATAFVIDGTVNAGEVAFKEKVTCEDNAEIGGKANLTQLLIKANAAQTANLLVVRDAASNIVMLVDAQGHLRFAGNGDYWVENERYAFRSSFVPAVGMVFSALFSRFEYRDIFGLPVYTVDLFGNSTQAGKAEINGELDHNGATLGFYGVTPVTRRTGYTTFTNLTTDRTCDANATSVAELADILGTLIEDLKATGIIGS